MSSYERHFKGAENLPMVQLQRITLHFRLKRADILSMNQWIGVLKIVRDTSATATARSYLFVIMCQMCF
jgi:hypothetical protein